MMVRRKISQISLSAPRLHVVALIATLLVTLGTGGATAEKLYYGGVLSGAQVPTPTGSPALGGGRFIIDTDANTLTYHISFVGLVGAEIAAHIHGPADPGATGSILHTLPAGNPKVGTWSYTEGLEGDILGGKTYVNIHTAVFPSAEVRCQISPLNAELDGMQEVPPVTTSGRGWGVFQIDTVANELSFYIDLGGLVGTETGAHIHGPALHGSNAGVAFALPSGRPKVGAWTYMEAEEEGILNGHYYVNIHTTASPTGEIRGQIVPTVVPIDAQQEVPPNPSPAAGVALLSIDTMTDDLSYDVRFAGLVGTETMAHIHGFAPPGANAAVLHTLLLGNRKLGIWNYGAANEMDLLDGLTYFNIHSTAVASGEIRGQILGLPKGASSSVDPRQAVAASLSWTRMAPNPLSRSGSIQFRLEQPGAVQVELYDAQGRLIRDLGERSLAAGRHAVAWDGRDAAGRPVESGIYHYVLRTSDGRVSRPVSLIR